MTGHSDLPNQASITLTVQSIPFPGDMECAPAFYEAVGRIAILWGRFEYHLDGDLLTCINIARRFGTEREMMVSLRRKTALLRELFQTVPAFRSREPIITPLTKDIEETGADRALLVHSHIIGPRDGNPPVLVLRNTTYKRGMVIFRNAEITLTQLHNMISTIDSLNTRLLAATWGLASYAWDGGL